MTEKTSGTLSGSKVIPYTKRHLKNYLNMLGVWCYDVLNFEKLNFEKGKTFISVSPVLNSTDTITEDDEYLPFILRLFIYLSVEKTIIKLR